jgi:hypothetical protein
MVVVGVQLTTFGALSRYYASKTGMLPSGPRSDWLVRTISTDRLLIAAGLILLAGFALFGFAIESWAKVSFGNLVDPLIPRVVIMSFSLMVIALQLGFAAFLFGIFNIPLRSRKG